jgi:hypothetical protein
VQTEAAAKGSGGAAAAAGGSLAGTAGTPPSFGLPYIGLPPGEVGNSLGLGGSGDPEAVQ